MEQITSIITKNLMKPMSPKLTTINLNHATKEKLAKLGHFGQSYESIILELLRKAGL